MRFLFLTAIAALATAVSAQHESLQVDQDYAAALALAAEHDKLVLVDIYTTWCRPCKKLDQVIFQNPKQSARLAKDFVLLRYDAEQDSVHHLAKKFHTSLYPDALVLRPDGQFVHRAYGFGADRKGKLIKQFFTFTEAAKDSADAAISYPGYARGINASIYPKFYRDYVERTDIRPEKNPAFAAFWTEPHDRLAEAYFTPLVYFASSVPDEVCDQLLVDVDRYRELYFEGDVNFALYFASVGRLSRAVEARDLDAFEAAAAYASAALGEGDGAEMAASYRKDLEAPVED